MPTNDAKSEGSARVNLPRKMPLSCPNNATHRNTRVYTTKGRVRHCVCDDCGTTFKVAGDQADPLVEFARNLADSLEKAEPVAAADGKGQVILVDTVLVAEIVRQLRGLTKSA